MHVKDLEMGLGLCPNVPIMRIPIFTFTKKIWLLKLTKNFSVSVPCPFLFFFWWGCLFGQISMVWVSSYLFGAHLRVAGGGWITHKVVVEHHRVSCFIAHETNIHKIKLKIWRPCVPFAGTLERKQP